MILQASGVAFAYPETGAILRGVDLQLEPGMVMGLFGPNGSGKSTLLHCLNGVLRPQQGSVCLDGRTLAKMSPREVARNIAVVPQDTRADLSLTVHEMVMLGRYPFADFWGEETREDLGAVAASLSRVHAEHLARRSFNQLSGGERQRVVIARALAQGAKVLLLDEPASHLDIARQLELYHLLSALSSAGYAILIVTHDIMMAPLFLNRAILLVDGQILASGEPDKVLSADRIREAFQCREFLDRFLVVSRQWPEADGRPARRDPRLPSSLE
jgi:iron complex transport system ATP-binding protein